MQHLAVHTRFSEGTAAVIISGELDFCTAPALQHALSEVADRGPERLVLDLAEVTFIDCAAARVLVAASRALPNGRKAVIRRPSRMVDRVLQLTGMSAYFWIERPPPRYRLTRPPRPRRSHEIRTAVLPAGDRWSSPLRRNHSQRGHEDKVADDDQRS